MSPLSPKLKCHPLPKIWGCCFLRLGCISLYDIAGKLCARSAHSRPSWASLLLKLRAVSNFSFLVSFFPRFSCFISRGVSLWGEQEVSLATSPLALWCPVPLVVHIPFHSKWCSPTVLSCTPLQLVGPLSKRHQRTHISNDWEYLSWSDTKHPDVERLDLSRAFFGPFLRKLGRFFLGVAI